VDPKKFRDKKPVRYEADLGERPRDTLYACGGIIEPGRDATFRWPASDSLPKSP
jgi:hypothetical protein